MSNIANVDMVIYMYIAYKGWTALSLLVTGKANKGKAMKKLTDMHESFLVIQYTCGYCMVWWHTGYIGTHINGEYMNTNSPHWISSHLHKKLQRIINLVSHWK